MLDRDRPPSNTMKQSPGQNQAMGDLIFLWILLSMLMTGYDVLEQIWSAGVAVGSLFNSSMKDVQMEDAISFSF